jgi:hypothetical protein
MQASRSDQIATRAATSHWRAIGAAPDIGHNPLPAPTSRSENVQMVSIQPEFPVPLLHQPHPRHRNRQRHRHRSECLETRHDHAKSPLTAGDVMVL